MAYRKRAKMSAKLAAMRAGKERARLARPAPEYPPTLPELRRTIIVVDHDFGEVTHRIDLYRTARVDCYRAVADGRPWKNRIGWSRVLATLRKSFPRLPSPRSLP